MRSILRYAVGAAGLLMGLAPRGAAAQAAPDTTLVVSTAWLAAHLGDADLGLLHVDRGDSAYRVAHIPGARASSPTWTSSPR